MTKGLNAAIIVLEGRLDDFPELAQEMADSKVAQRFFKALETYRTKARLESLRVLLDRSIRIQLKDGHDWVEGTVAVEALIEEEMTDLNAEL